jgi:hypothetical protein
MKKQHYWLVAGTVMFGNKAEETIGNVSLNTTTRTDADAFPSREIGRAQQALQMLFFKRILQEDQANIQVVDVVIISVNYLGEMTEEEFLRPPEGTTVAEVLGGKPN